MSVSRRREPADLGTSHSCRTPCAGACDAPQFGHNECARRREPHVGGLARAGRRATHLALRDGHRSTPRQIYRSSDRRAAQRGSSLGGDAVAARQVAVRRRRSRTGPRSRGRRAGPAAARAGARRAPAARGRSRRRRAGRSRPRAGCVSNSSSTCTEIVAADRLEAAAARRAPGGGERAPHDDALGDPLEQQVDRRPACRPRSRPPTPASPSSSTDAATGRALPGCRSAAASGMRSVVEVDGMIARLGCRRAGEASVGACTGSWTVRSGPVQGDGGKLPRSAPAGARIVAGQGRFPLCANRQIAPKLRLPVVLIGA